MNAAIRAVLHAGPAQDWEVVAIRRGFTGLIDGDVVRLARATWGIIQRGPGRLRPWLRSRRSCQAPVMPTAPGAELAVTTFEDEAALRAFPLPETYLYRLISDPAFKRAFHTRIKQGNRWLAPLYKLHIYFDQPQCCDKV
jgi:hypothetical protein